MACIFYVVKIVKNSIIRIMLYLLTWSPVLAQTNRTATTSATGTFGGEISLPVIVTEKFKEDYPNIAATWSMDEDNYAAQYRDVNSNLAHIIVYDRYGKLVRKDNEVQKPSHPPGVCSYYAQHYPNEEYLLWESIDASGKKTYYSQREVEMICFDKNGKFVSSKKIEGQKKNEQSTQKSK
jgi:hypothetical protein